MYGIRCFDGECMLHEGAEYNSEKYSVSTEDENLRDIQETPKKC